MTDPTNTTAKPEIIERLNDAVDHAHAVLAGVQLEIFTLKRGVVGNYHHVSKKYLPLNLAEFTFRHNHGKDPNLFDSIVAGC